MTCKSSNLVYMVICFTSNEEYIGETGEEKTRVRVYRQHIHQPQYQQLKNVRNIFEFVEKENSKYYFSSNYIQTINYLRYKIIFCQKVALDV